MASVRLVRGSLAGPSSEDNEEPPLAGCETAVKNIWTSPKTPDDNGFDPQIHESTTPCRSTYVGQRQGGDVRDYKDVKGLKLHKNKPVKDAVETPSRPHLKISTESPTPTDPMSSTPTPSVSSTTPSASPNSIFWSSPPPLVYSPNTSSPAAGLKTPSTSPFPHSYRPLTKTIQFPDSQDLQWDTTVIGKGTFCKVMKGTLKNKVYAVKMALSENQSQVIIHEAMILSQLIAEQSPGVSIPGLIQFHGLIESHSALVLTFCPQSLEDYIKICGKSAQETSGSAFSPYIGPVWTSWALQLLKGLRFLKSHQIVHSDIKPANVLISADSQALLADFSSAQTLQEIYNPSSSTGSPLSLSSAAFSIQYSAPELLSSTNQTPSFASDAYSLGLTLLNAATGQEPYHLASKNFAQMLMWARKGKALSACSQEDLDRIAGVRPVLDQLLTKRWEVEDVIEGWR